MTFHLENIQYRYQDGTRALNGIEARFEKPERIALMGENGSGKSTLFHIMTGLLRPSGGRVRIDSVPVEYRGQALRNWRSSVGFVFQDPDIQLICSTVEQEVSYGPVNLGLTKEKVKERARTAMAQTDVQQFAEKPVHFLSYGQKKRVSIADILAMEPQMILLDEPTAGLDPRHKRSVLDVLNSLHRLGKIIVMATHDVNLAYSWADRVIFIAEGKIVYDGDPAGAFEDEKRLRAGGLEEPELLEVRRRLRENGVILPNSGTYETAESLAKEIQNLLNRKG